MRGRAFVTLFQQLYFIEISIKVIIWTFYFVDKTTRKRRNIYNNSEKESYRDDLQKKWQLQNCNETQTPLAVIETTTILSFSTFEACGEKIKCL